MTGVARPGITQGLYCPLELTVCENVDLKLDQHRRLRSSIKPTLGIGRVFSGGGGIAYLDIVSCLYDAKGLSVVPFLGTKAAAWH